MSTIYDDSVFQIQSQDKTNSKFGTGFVFYVDEKGSYFATCLHILEQVKNPLINNEIAKVITDGSEKNIDLAVLYLEGVFLKPLQLQALDCKDGDVKLIGYSKFTSNQDQVKEREATLLGDKVKLKNKENNNTHYAWQIIAKDNFEIESGNSGGPLLCNVTHKVMAVMSHNVRGGEGGFAIDIEHLKDIWQDIPKELFDVKENPYKGLSSFGFDDRKKYFGREEEQESIAKTLEKEETRLFTLLGASGSGKSSLLFAGILPLIQKEGVQILSFRPSEEPFRKLANIFIPTLYPDPTDRSEQKDKLPEKLKNADVKLNSLCETFFEMTSVKTLYIIIDQFEELFSLTKEKAVKQLFLDQLLMLVNSKLNVKLIIAMRSDFITHFSFYEAFSKAYDNYPTKTLTLMLEPNLEKAIRLPSENLDISFEEGLIARMLKEVSDEDGQLPLLEFTLHILWEKIENAVISHKAYDEIGGIAKAISQYADEVYVRYDKPQQEDIQRIFLKLVNPGRGAEDTRRVATFDDFSSHDHGLLKLLADHKLIVTKDNEIEVIHEALIREWTRLKDWVNEFREFLEWEKQTREDYRVYETNGDLLRDSKLLNASKFLERFEKQISERYQKFIRESIRKDRREKRKKVVVFSVIGLVLIGLTLFAFMKWNDAESKTDLLKIESKKTEKQLEEAEHNLGLVFAEKATQFEKNKEYRKAHYFAYQALSKFSDEKNDTTLSTMYSILGNNRTPLTSFLIDVNSTVNSVDFSFDGKKVVSASTDGIIKVWDAKTGKELQSFDKDTWSVSSVNFSPNGKKIVSGCEDGTIRVWDVETGQEVLLLEGHRRQVNSVNFSANGKKIASSFSDKTILIWDTETGKEIQVFKGHSNSVFSVKFSTDGKKVVSGSYDKTIRIWDVETGKELHVFKGHTESVLSVDFSTDGKKIVSGSLDKTVRIWDVETGKELHVFKGHTASIFSVEFSTDGKKIVSGSLDKTIRIWDVRGDSNFQVIKGHTKPVYALNFSPNGKKIVSGSFDKTIRVWDTETGKELQILKGHTKTVNSVSFAPNGKKIVSSSFDKTIRVWDAKTYKELQLFEGHTNIVLSVNFSSNGKKIVSCSFDNTIRVWDVKTGKELQLFEAHNWWAEAVNFSSDGKTIVSGSLDKTIQVWDVATGKELQLHDKDRKHTRSISFSTDGTKMLSFTRDKTIRIWDTKTGKELKRLIGHMRGDDGCVRFSANEKKIVSSSNDGTIRVWDVETAKELYLLKGQEFIISSINLSPNEKKIILGLRDNTILIWNLDTLLKLDNPKFIKKQIKFLEQQLQAKLDGINLKHKSIPFSKYIYSKYSPNYWLEEANEGNTTAMYELGIVYDRENENENALKWYEKASNKGHSGAKERLEMLRKWMVKNGEKQ